MAGPVQYLSGQVILDENVPFYYSTKTLSQFPFTALCARVSSVIGVLYYDLILLFLFSFVYFIGTVYMCYGIVRDRYVALLVAVFAGALPWFQGVSYSYEFMSGINKHYGLLLQSLIPSVFFTLLSGKFFITGALLVFLTAFHPGYGVVLFGFSIVYIAFIKNRTLKEKFNWVVAATLPTSIFLLYFMQLRGDMESYAFDTWIKLIFVSSVGHVLPWFQKNQVSSLAYAFLALFTLLWFVKTMEHKDAFRHLSRVYYLASIVSGYVFLIILIPVAAYYLKLPEILSMILSRASVLLGYGALLLAAVFVRFTIVEYKAGGLPFILLLFIAFCKAPFLLFPLIGYMKWNRGAEKAWFKHLPFALLFMTACFLRFSPESYVSFSVDFEKAVLAGVCVFLWACSFFSGRLSFHLTPAAFHVLFVFVIGAAIGSRALKCGVFQKELFDIGKYEKQMLDYIDKNVSKDAVFFVFQDEGASRENAWLRMFSYVNYRSTALNPECITTVNNFPGVTKIIIEGLNSIYGLSVQDLRRGPQVMVDAAMNFSAHDWLRIKKFHKNLGYVLLTHDRKFPVPSYFENAMSNKYFKLYSINWKMLHEGL